MNLASGSWKRHANEKADDSACARRSRVRGGTRYGNAEFVANIIQRETGADIWRIETVQTYPTEHKALLDFTNAEQKKKTHPALKGSVSLADYDTVILCYPIWWYGLPMSVHSFLDSHDLGGKTVHLAVVHGGSRLSGTDREIAQAEPKATVSKNALVLSRDSVAKSEKQIVEWARGL